MSDKLRLRLRRIPKGNIIAQAAEEIPHDLCERLRISRSSVREALRVLEALGLVQKIQGKGVFVRKQRPAFLSQRHPPKAMRAIQNVETVLAKGGLDG